MSIERGGRGAANGWAVVLFSPRRYRKQHWSAQICLGRVGVVSIRRAAGGIEK